MPVILIGFMGAGKTSVAAALARLSGRPSCDLDELILEQSSYLSVSALFQAEGESGFRERETAALKDALLNFPGFLSTGGGVIERDENIALLQTAGVPVCYLEVSFSEVERRLADDQSRPLFKDRQSALELYHRRLQRYRSVASFTVQTDERDIEAVAAEIFEQLSGGVDNA